MKRILMLLIGLTIVVGASAFSSNDIEGKKKAVGSENITPEQEAGKNGGPLEFNLNADDAVVLVQRPTCGSGGNSGWVYSHTERNNGVNTYYEKRSCDEIITVVTPFPPGFIVFSYETTETREMPSVE